MAPVPDAGFQVWPHPYQVDHGESATSARRRVSLAYRPLPFGVGRRCPHLLVSADRLPLEFGSGSQRKNLHDVHVILVAPCPYRARKLWIHDRQRGTGWTSGSPLT
jgi:hypothetical protein